VTPYRWTIRDVLQATGGSLVSGTDGQEFAGIDIDSRTIGPDRIFAAIAGENHDGHRFVADVLAQGGQGFVVAERQAADLPLDRMRASGAACVTVADTTMALGDLARFNRNRGPLKVLAITGSNGKTSTRMLTEQVVSEKYATLGTRGNLNNHIGLPLTLLRRAPQHEAAVVELGMNHPGEITCLGEICQPDVGIITNVAPAHLEGLGTVDNVAAAKGELLATIRSGGTAVLNADDVRVAALADACACPVLFFGTGDRAGIRAENIRPDSLGLVFTLVTPSGEIDIRLATPMKAMVANALAAASAGEVLNVSLDRIKAGLEAFSPGAGRMAIRELEGGIRLLDDTYNANPGSMAAAIETLAAMGADGRTHAVLGDMLELGDLSHALHRKIGRAVGEAGIDRLYAAGRFAFEVAEGAREGRMTDDRIFVGTKAEIIEQLGEELRAGDQILVKGSRGMAMEEVAEEIIRWTTEGTR
jgi:UDP-N-acetylmuramoyl-tripeptide--D-alanyl-D-alanine ligase